MSNAQEWRRDETDPYKALVKRVQKLEAIIGRITNEGLKNAGLSVTEDEISSDRTIAVEGGGNLEVRDGGQLRVEYPESIGAGQAGVYFGRIIGEVDGTYQGTGLLFEGPDSTHNLMQVRTDETGDRHVFQVWDNQLTPVLSILADRGLNAPTLSVPMNSDYWQTWGSTASSSWTDVSYGGTRIWHQHVWAVCRTTSSESGTTGELRFVLTYDDIDYVIGSAVAVGFAIDSRTFEGPIPSEIPIGGFVRFRVQARLTSGTGRIHGTARYVEMQP